jgi:diacylglycerol kinase family enzyme
VWQPADAGRVVLDGGEPRYFINVASVGFSARVAEAKGRMPSWIPRSLAYLLPTLLELPRAAPTRLRLTAAGAALEGQAWAVFICNGRFAGGGMRFGADARLDDGRFEVSWIEGISALGVLRKLPQVYSSRGLVEQPGVRKLEASDLVIEAPTGGSLLLDLDGEPTSAARAEFAILPAEEIGLHVRRLGRKPD